MKLQNKRIRRRKTQGRSRTTKAKEKEDLEQKEYDQFVKQQQEFLKQFFGFNLGPAIPTKDGANAFTLLLNKPKTKAKSSTKTKTVANSTS